MSDSHVLHPAYWEAAILTQLVSLKSSNGPEDVARSKMNEAILLNCPIWDSFNLALELMESRPDELKQSSPFCTMLAVPRESSQTILSLSWPPSTKKRNAGSQPSRPWETIRAN
ncbi:hypothetical protein AVEN_118836-1 [Araneus ventricosus]|uniref:Uncharacterized protein n=1 Tax=Araneus ventricosus TaxID=182803 RepID=A0A4Y2I9T9_ARAVE|nr:hypothetical protein AVEN_118836-1 [Araneus ventricosus]